MVATSIAAPQRTSGCARPEVQFSKVSSPTLSSNSSRPSNVRDGNYEAHDLFSVPDGSSLLSKNTIPPLKQKK